MPLFGRRQPTPFVMGDTPRNEPDPGDYLAQAARCVREAETVFPDHRARLLADARRLAALGAAERGLSPEQAAEILDALRPD